MSREAAAARQIPLINMSNHKYWMQAMIKECLNNDVYYCVAVTLMCALAFDLGWVLGWIITL